MRRTWRKAKPKPVIKFNANERIRAEYVFLIDENGEKLGKISTKEALLRARDLELDLVEVNPKGEFPVAKIMDFGQFKYEKEKKIQKQKNQQTKVEVKGVRLSVRISKHDLELRVDRAKKFIKKGNKLKIELILKGREKQHPEKAVEMIKDFAAQVEEDSELNIMREQDLTKQGGAFTMILVNKKD